MVYVLLRMNRRKSLTRFTLDFEAFYSDLITLTLENKFISMDHFSRIVRKKPENACSIIKYIIWDWTVLHKFASKTLLFEKKTWIKKIRNVFYDLQFKYFINKNYFSCITTLPFDLNKMKNIKYEYYIITYLMCILNFPCKCMSVRK